MELYLERQAITEHDAVFRNILQLDNQKTALRTIRNLENARRKFVEQGDKEGLRQLKQIVVEGKKDAQKKAVSAKVPPREKLWQAEIAEWLTIWLQTPEIFESWVSLRRKSKDFLDRFDESESKDK
jgi:uncharacterized Zn finger protein